MQLLQHEQHLPSDELIQSAEHYLKQQHGLSHNIQQQIKNFITTPSTPPSIEQLFKNLDKQKSQAVHTSTLLHALRQKTQTQLRQILSQSSHIETIVNSPAATLTEFLSLLNPDPSAIIQRLEPLKNETFSSRPWTGKQIYQAMIKNLIAEPSSTTSTEKALQKLIQNTVTQQEPVNKKHTRVFFVILSV